MKPGTSKSTIRSNNRVVANEHYRLEMQIRELLTSIKMQKYINTWNTAFVGKLDRQGKSFGNYFDTIQIEADSIIIHTYMENRIKELKFSEDGKIIKHVAGFSQIDNRQQTTDKPNWVDTPMPIIEKGVIMAISADNQIKYANRKIEFEKLFPGQTYHVPKVGDTVYLRPFNAREQRYYINKQERIQDLVRTQTEWNLNNFDFLFNVSTYDIEAIIPAEKAQDLGDAPMKYEYLEIINNINGENIAKFFNVIDTAEEDQSDEDDEDDDELDE